LITILKNIKKIIFRRGWNRRAMFFFIFLFISGIFWVLSSLDKSYTTIISYPVEYMNFPPNKVLVEDVPNKIKLGVSGQGYNILKLLISANNNPVIFNVNSFSLNRLGSDETTRFYILTQMAKDKIKRQISENIVINDLQPDTIYFTFSERSVKKIPVKPNCLISIEKQYVLKDKIKINPDSILVEGARIFLDTMQYIYTELVETKKLSKGFQKNVALKNIPHIKFDKEIVTLNIDVEKYTEIEYTIPIQTINVPDSVNLLTIPSDVIVSFKVGISKFESTNLKQFKATVNYNEIGHSINEKLKVSIKNYPEFVEIVSFNPKSVNYLIKKYKKEIIN